ncbi:hypothetical protein [Laribacter hongkongensis]|uniref:hypothetical protein n=1 Tax=Laribacter hongkongensis TaxID=168471 RepID=UPI001EFCA5E0|nr:hypothetical protein [Laribacter hongkongensis]MCG9077717.1 hypothetical protein [Laribacter hongkongensis]
MRDADKSGIVDVARELQRAGFGLCATRGTAKVLSEAGVGVQIVNKVTEHRPNIVDMIKNGEIAMVINTVAEKRQSITDSQSIRSSALQNRVPQYTTLAGARAVAHGIATTEALGVYPLQGLHAELA